MGVGGSPRGNPLGSCARVVLRATGRGLREASPQGYPILDEATQWARGPVLFALGRVGRGVVLGRGVPVGSG